MARYLAIEWDHHVARLAIATEGGSRLTMRHAATVELPPHADEADEAHQAIGHALREALVEHRVATRWLQTLVVVPRSAVELRMLNLPPAADEDLAGSVEAAAPRELSSITEQTVVDFLPLSGPVDQPRHVEVTAIAPEQIESVMAVCRAAGLTPSSILLRPHAHASLVERSAAPAESVYLICDDLGRDVELTVVAQRDVVLSRSVRLESDQEQEDRNALLLSEIRRTVIAAQNQPLAGKVEAVYLFGPSEGAEHLAQQIERELLPVHVVDPFSACKLRSPLAKSRPREGGRFAALVGAILDASEGVAPAVDYLHPRRRTEPTVDRRPWIIAAAAAAVLLALWFVSWGQIAAVDRQMEALSKESKDLEKAVKRAVETQRAVEIIETWSAGDIVWLDELRDLSLRFPSARDAVLLRLTMARASAGGGAMELHGLVRDPSIVGRFERELRDSFHEVRSGRVDATVREQSYTWQFESSLSVAKRPKVDYLAVQPNHVLPVQVGVGTTPPDDRETTIRPIEDAARGAIARPTERP